MKALKSTVSALAIAAALLTAACSNSSTPAPSSPAAPVSPPLATTVASDQAKIEAGLDTGCGVVSTASALAQPLAGVPAVGVTLGFAGGACVAGKATAALIDKALADPSTQAWLDALPGQINAAVAAVKSL